MFASTTSADVTRVLLALGLVGLGGCQAGPSERAGDVPDVALHVLSGEAFGTTWTVKWRGPQPPATEAEARIVAVLEDVDAAMSTWRDDSELLRVRATEGPVAVSEDTFAVVDAALDLAQATEGAFDPTVEPLMELWGFRGKPRESLPSDQEIAAARARVGWQKVSLSRTAEGPRIASGGTALDLSAIAKGHAVDRVSFALSELGATDHLVEIGGEVRAQGSGPSGPWRLAVDSPEAPGRRFAATIALRNAALATSGNYRNAYDSAGVRIVHTMDPRTGKPHASEVASVTVVAPDCRTADGWATALMVLDPGAGRAAIDARPSLEALWLVAGDDGFDEIRSTGMDRWVLE